MTVNRSAAICNRLTTFFHGLRIVDYKKCTLCLLMLLFVGAGCQESSMPAPPEVTPLPTTETLMIGVSEGALGLVELVDYVRPNVTLTHPSTSDGVLLADLDAGLLDAALVHHLPAARNDLWFNPLALDGLLLIVHPENPLSSVTLAEAQALFAGLVNDWASFGLADGAITLLVPQPAAGSAVLFERFVLQEQRLSIHAQLRPNPSTIIDAVAASPNALGLVTASALAADAAVKPLAIDGIAPSPTTLGTQEYPLSMPLYWVSVAEPQGELRGVLAYLQSVEGQSELGARFGRIR